MALAGLEVAEKVVALVRVVLEGWVEAAGRQGALAGMVVEKEVAAGWEQTEEVVVEPWLEGKVAGVTEVEAGLG